MLKAVGLTIAAVAAFLLLSVGLLYLTGAISIGTSDFRGEVDKHEQVEADGSYRIAQYDRFHNLCQDIQAKNEEIALAEQSLSGQKKEDVVYAHQTAKIEMVGDYNAMAAKDYTAGQFRDSDLPYHIDPNDEEVECG